MAEVTKPVVVTPQPFVFNKKACADKSSAIRIFLQGFVGKPGYNSALWIAKKLKPLEDRLNGGGDKEPEESKELQDAFAALKQEEPIAKGAEHNVTHPPKEPQAAGGSSNAGQVPPTPYATVSQQVTK